MKLSLPDADSPRILPVVMLALLALIGVRTGDLWIGISGAGATETESPAVLDAPPENASRPASAGRSAADERILQHLGDRRAELDAREAALSTREAVLAAAEARLEARLAEIAEGERRLEALAAAGAVEVEREIARLSDAYERMKPRDAARIFEALESDLLGEVAAGMRTQSLAAVLGEMDAASAKALTELLAMRRADVNTALTP